MSTGTPETITDALTSLLQECFSPEECRHELLRRLEHEIGGNNLLDALPAPETRTPNEYFFEVANAIDRRGLAKQLINLMLELRPARQSEIQSVRERLRAAPRPLAEKLANRIAGKEVFLRCRSWRLPATVRLDLEQPAFLVLEELFDDLGISRGEWLSASAGNIRTPIFIHNGRELDSDRSLRSQGVSAGDVLWFAVVQESNMPGRRARVVFRSGGAEVRRWIRTVEQVLRKAGFHPDL